MKICIIDNYDSFTYNIYHQLLIEELKVDVFRNDEITVKEIKQKNFDAVVIGPGPSNPKNAGICLELIRESYKELPILGVCLGHQCIGEAFGGNIVVANNIMHGKTSLVNHANTSVFKGLKDPYHVMRYHSLIVDYNDFPEELEVTGWTFDQDKKVIMSLEHKVYPVVGIQFHPESIFTEQGSRLIQNFLEQING